MLDTKNILAARILIVDDQESNVQLLEQLMADAGYTHVSATMLPVEVCALHQKKRFRMANSVGQPAPAGLSPIAILL